MLFSSAKLKAMSRQSFAVLGNKRLSSCKMWSTISFSWFFIKTVVKFPSPLAPLFPKSFNLSLTFFYSVSKSTNRHINIFRCFFEVYFLINNSTTTKQTIKNVKHQIKILYINILGYNRSYAVRCVWYFEVRLLTNDANKAQIKISQFIKSLIMKLVNVLIASIKLLRNYKKLTKFNENANKLFLHTTNYTETTWHESGRE